MTGRAGGVRSQDLFLTPEQCSQSQQSSSGEPDAGEGSSGKSSVCFSTAGTHLPMYGFF